MLRYILLSAALVLSAGCAAPGDDVPQAALDAITADGLSDGIATLASDAFEGRAPSSPGEEKTVAYLEAQFRTIGLEPGNGDSYFQQVPLVAITANPDMQLSVADESGRSTYAYGDDFMAWTTRIVESVHLDASEMVFVGFGVVAPEYDWNDYAGLDVRGKTVVMLINDPGFGSGDPSLFNGNAMTYYGRWTYKFEEAARQGAAAAFIVHETEPASYPWEVVSGSWSGPQFDLVPEDNNMSRVTAEGWLHIDTARALFQRAGLDFDAEKARARTRAFSPVSLRLTASMDIANTIRRSESRNVIATLPGRTRPDEYVIYMAHWDHFGIDPSLEGDQIYNGAVDNASGTAGLLEIARGFAALPQRPERSVAFLAVTAEEQGLLGGRYYAEYPIIPTAQTAAAINIDGVNLTGPTRDLTVVGYGNSELDRYLTEAAEAQGRVVRPDPEPQKGFFYRSDHFSFAKKGVPALYTDPGIDDVARGEAYGIQMREDYTANRYHKPADEFDPNWDFSGAVQDLRLLLTVGYRVANTDHWPTWNDGTEFKAIREAERPPQP
ncbi:MAG: M28 family metallopeptidase [Rhodothermales bacterium]